LFQRREIAVELLAQCKSEVRSPAGAPGIAGNCPSHRPVECV